MSRGNFITDRNDVLNPNYKDGRKNTRLYRIYNNMKTRCYNENAQHYHRYGGRGIKICNEWLEDFSNFKKWSMENGYSNNLTIDRINNNGNYEPSNCRWVNIKTQANNTSSNVIITINDKTKTLTEWCTSIGISYKTVRDRLKRGWNIEDALFKPVNVKFRRKAS